MQNRDKEIVEYFNQLDRGYFMPDHKESAKLDQAFPIGHGQTISQPSLVLKMTLALDIHQDAKVLEIGTGSGFQTALLAAFSRTVFTVERIKELQEQAKERLINANYHNVHYKQDDGSLGWEENAPYDRIIVTAAASEIPKELVQQLKKGGKMIIPIGSKFSQELQLIEKKENGEIISSFLEHVVFVRLQGKYD